MVRCQTHEHESAASGSGHVDWLPLPWHGARDPRSPLWAATACADVLWTRGSTDVHTVLMRVITRQSRGRWALVAAGTLLLCGLPALIGAWPVGAAGLSASQLRARILASAAVPYQGYAES